MTLENSLTLDIRRIEATGRHQTEAFRRSINEVLCPPLSFNLEDPEKKRAYDEALHQESGRWIFIDNRVSTLVSLYERFNPQEKGRAFLKNTANSDIPTLSFRKWLEKIGVKPRSLRKGL